MIAFFVGLWANPLFRRILIYAAIAAGALYALRIYGNRRFEEGYSKASVAAIVDAEKAAREKFEAERKALETERYELDARLGEIQTAAAQLKRDRAVLQTGLNKGIESLKGELTLREQDVCAVPVSMLADTIRRQLRAVRTAESSEPDSK